MMSYKFKFKLTMICAGNNPADAAAQALEYIAERNPWPVLMTSACGKESLVHVSCVQPVPLEAIPDVPAAVVPYIEPRPGVVQAMPLRANPAGVVDAADAPQPRNRQFRLVPRLRPARPVAAAADNIQWMIAGPPGPPQGQQVELQDAQARFNAALQRFVGEQPGPDPDGDL